MRWSVALVAVVALCGCFDSIVDSPCAAGYQLVGGQCVSRVEPPDGGDDAPPGGGDGGDAGPLCELPLVACADECVDLSSDPDNCGACGRVCASGICSAGSCVGALAGHIVAIGHDYRDHNAAMRRVLGNAAALAAGTDLAIARIRGSAVAAAHTGTRQALASGLAVLGRDWHEVNAVDGLAGIDVAVIEAQLGDGDVSASLGAMWAPSLDGVLQRGGVVIVLEGASGVSFRFAAAAALYVASAPVDASGSQAMIVDASDAIAQQVVSPYLAEFTSVAMPGVSGPLVTAAGTLVVHQTRF
jgi:hypothetical protein